METYIEGTMYGAHIDGTMYGDSYRGYYVWRPIQGLPCMETHIEGVMFGESYRGYNVRRLI